MALYKLFLFRNGDLAGAIKRHCADDLDALDAARAVYREDAVEVNTDTRLVARVKRTGAPLAAEDRHAGWETAAERFGVAFAMHERLIENVLEDLIVMREQTKFMDELSRCSREHLRESRALLKRVNEAL